MRTLVDGYNLMHALGRLEKRFGPDGFRKARNRFLDDLARALGPVSAHGTTVVFDAREAPGDLPRRMIHKGITVLFADEDEGADARIERLIAADSVPKALTVVSSDHRIRRSAAHRKARALTAEAFWDGLEAPRRHASPPSPPPATAEEEARLHGLSPEDAADWLEAFRDIADEPEIRAGLGANPTMLTDEEIARIAREVEEEDRIAGR
jgi:predicted RNA-binding protein with PIN domain